MRRTFAMAPADFVVDPLTGLPKAGASVDIYLTDRTTRVTDLRVGSTAVSTIVSDVNGRVVFQGPDQPNPPLSYVLKSGPLFYTVFSSDFGDVVAAEAAADTAVQSALLERVSRLEAAAVGGATGGVVASTAPSVVRSLVATPTTTSVAVSWAAPESTGGEPVTGYVVVRQPGNARVDVAGLSTSFTGLLQDTAYAVSVSAVNRVGTGVSASVTARTLVVAPGAAVPTASVSRVTASSASLTWADPVSPAQAVVSRQFGWAKPSVANPADSYLWTGVDPSNPFVFQGLAPNSLYDLFVQVMYAGGAGSPPLVGPVTFAGPDGGTAPAAVGGGFTNGGSSTVQGGRWQLQTGAQPAGTYDQGYRIIRVFQDGSGSPISRANVELLATVRFAGGNVVPRLMLCSKSDQDQSDTAYTLEILPGGALTLTKADGYTYTGMGTYSGLPPADATDYKVDFRVFNGLVQVWWWTAGATRPVAPQISYTDPTPLPAGFAGVAVSPAGDVGAGTWLLDDLSLFDGASAGGGGGGTAGPRTVVSAKTDVAPVNAAPAPGTTGIGERTLAIYHNKWQGPNVSEITAVRVSNVPVYNVAYGFVAQCAVGGTGKLYYGAEFAGKDRFVTDKAASRAAGCKWVLTIGGANDGGLVLKNDANVAEMVQSVKDINTEYGGFDGIDWDIEADSWNEASLVAVSRQLKAFYGRSFIISMVPRPWETVPFAAARTLGADLDIFQMQFYDSPEYSDLTQAKSLIRQRVGKAVVEYSIAASKILLGVCNSTYSNGGMTASNAVAVYKDIQSIYPTIRGVMNYDSPLEKADGWKMAYALFPVVRAAAVAAPPPPAPVAGDWLSGVAGREASDGSFAAWMGGSYKVEIGGTWADSLEAQTALWQIQPGGEWGAWQGPLDIAVGGIFHGAGETWAQAAAGAYDSRWSSCLQGLKSLRSGRGATFLRFAHEFNLNGNDGDVGAGQGPNFVAGWKRFRALQKSIFPEARLVWCPNDGTSSGLSALTQAWPGAAFVDVYGVDSYNGYPAVNTLAQFQDRLNVGSGTGNPVGLEAHRLQAAAWGVPLAICEWGSNGDPNDAGQGMDAANWYQYYHDWLAANGGTGPGKVLYEVLFNISNYGSGQFSIWPNTRQPQSQAAYRRLFGGASSSTPVAPAQPAGANTTSASSNPFVGATLYVDPYSSAANAANTETDPYRKSMLHRISDYAVARWLGDWIGDPQGFTKSRVDDAKAAGRLAVLVVYCIPLRDLGSYSAGGAASAAAYRTFVDGVAAGIAGSKCAVILEPDALPQLDGLAADKQAERITLLQYAVDKLTAAGATVYADAGNTNWKPAQTMADRVNQVGAGKLRGFALNVSNFQTTASTVTYGKQISAALGGKPFVIDSSRNGLGPLTTGTWDERVINPAGRALGDRPLSPAPDPLVDALLWVKPVGESDGNRAGAPNAGVFYPDYAIGLAERAPWAQTTTPPAPAAQPRLTMEP